MSREGGVVEPGVQTKPRVNFWDRLKEISMFFAGDDEVHRTARRLVDRLEKAGIVYAVAGGMAVNGHGHERTTKDVDVLLTPEGFAEFKRLYVPADYAPTPRRGRRFTDTVNGKTVDFLLTGLFPGMGQPGPIAFPEPSVVTQIIDNVRVVKLDTLIELKLAARRHQDFADVVNLIDVHNLDESFQARLHPSLHRDYIECLEEKRRNDEYESRHG